MLHSILHIANISYWSYQTKSLSAELSKGVFYFLWMQLSFV